MNTITARLHNRILGAFFLSLLSASLLSAQTAPVSREDKTESSKKIKIAEGKVAGEVVKAMELEEVTVTGSRVRQVDAEGPSPVFKYDRQYIDSTGAMTLADFLNHLPQTYSGIGAGRGSTPNELNPEFGQRTETTTPAFNFVLGSSAASPGQTGVSGVSLRGLGAGSTLVLVDGRRVAKSPFGNRSSDSQQGFVDLNGIPLGMVDRIEVITDGSSAIYGADAVGGVVNIILKKNWQGSELAGSFRGAFHGGGRERNAVLTSGFAMGKLQAMFSAEYYDRSDLKASQRRFTKNQDHRSVIADYDANGAPIYGRDLRINWGYPGVVQARTGTLSGFFRPDGVTPTNVALIPSGYATTPPLSAFKGAGPVPPNTSVFATGQSRANTAEFLDLIPESERSAFSARFTYDATERVKLMANYMYSDTRGLFMGQPPASSAATFSGFGNFSTVVPAAMNPFGQDVAVGMVHYEFGGLTQATRTKVHTLEVGASGEFFQTWRWEGVFKSTFNKGSSSNRIFNGAGITAALSSTDASTRINPFVDVRAGAPSQAAAYEKLALYNIALGEGETHNFELIADGSLYDLPGGKLQMAAGMEATRESVDNDSTINTIAVTPVAVRTVVGAERDSAGLFAEFSVPVFGKPNAKPLLQKLTLQLAGRYENYERAGDVFVPKVGISWAPAQWLLVRGGYSQGFRAPSITEYLPATEIRTATVTDPKRTPATTANVTVTRGPRTKMAAEKSDQYFYGLIFEPKGLKGFSIQANYYFTEQKDVLQILSAQTIVNNEALFLDRIVRGQPDPAVDVPLNQPGRIVSIDQTFINFGAVRNESVDFVANYEIPNETFGRWTISLNAGRTLRSERELAPNQPALVEDGDTFAPPKWKMEGSVLWRKGPWSGSLFATYLGKFETNRAGNSLTFTYPTPAIYKVDVRGGYQFQNGVWRGYGKGLRISGGIGNVFDKEPPFSDTVFGYNGGLHSIYVLGRSYEISFNLPF
ncbi:MAG: TonB-dependent receptor [Opitutaceae bacterium]|nr:TonB-dependent receptor [Opitutaceae bacterium]